MDKTLLFLLVSSLLLLTWQAPFGMLTVLGIIALSVVFVRATWGLLQGFNRSVPEAQRVPSDS